MERTPPFLKKGDTVGLVAPARKITREELCHAIHVFEEWGLTVQETPHLYHSNNQFSGTDAQRASDFQSLLNDSKVKAVFCVRGGYGCARIIDKLDFSTFSEQPKWVVGFSDITVFHAHIHKHLQTETLHAAMPVSITRDGISAPALESIRQALFGESLSYKVPSHPFNRKGTASAVLCGGNLSVIYSLMAGPSDVHTENKILFIEDLDEYLYHVDRMMVCLERAGRLSALAGLIVGGMNKMNDNPVPFGKIAYEIIRDTVAPYGYPVCFGFPAGHIKDNNALILGRKVELKVGDGGATLTF